MGIRIIQWSFNIRKFCGRNIQEARLLAIFLSKGGSSVVLVRDLVLFGSLSTSTFASTVFLYFLSFSTIQTVVSLLIKFQPDVCWLYPIFKSSGVAN